MNNAIAAGIVIGVVELLKNLIPNKISGAVTWVVAAVVGGVLGYFHLVGVVDITTGVALGTAAVGLHTVAVARGK